jgi:hypothetical protein
MAECRERRTLFAWSGGAGLPEELASRCPILVATSAEAPAWLGRSERTEPPIQLAGALASRACVVGAIRIVLGDAGAEPVAVVRDAGSAWECYEADPLDGPSDGSDGWDWIRSFFLTQLLIRSLLDGGGKQRARQEIEAGLRSARRAVALTAATGRVPTGAELESSLDAIGDESNAIRWRIVPKMGLGITQPIHGW